MIQQRGLLGRHEGGFIREGYRGDMREDSSERVIGRHEGGFIREGYRET